jgi:hypothetical protein
VARRWANKSANVKIKTPIQNRKRHIAKTSCGIRDSAKPILITAVVFPVEQLEVLEPEKLHTMDFCEMTCGGLFFTFLKKSKKKGIKSPSQASYRVGFTMAMTFAPLSLGMGYGV